MAIEIETAGDTSTMRQDRVSRAGVRAHTECINRLSKRDLMAGRAETADYGIARPLSLDETYPTTYGECIERRLGGEENPCHFVRCKWHLAIDVNPDTGAIKINHPGALDADGAIDLRAMPATCALHVAAIEHTLEDVGALVNITRERARQIETKGLKELAALNALAAYADDLRGDVHKGTESDERIGLTGKRVARGETRATGWEVFDWKIIARKRVKRSINFHKLVTEVDLSGELASSLSFSVRDGGE